jgi:hypothetical protein
MLATSKMLKKQIDKYIILSAIICAIISFGVSLKNLKTTQELAQSAELELHKKENIAITHLASLTELLKKNSPEDLFKNYQTNTSELYNKEGIALYVYHRDSLCFWSANQPAIELQAYTNESTPQLIKIRNGWFELIEQKDHLPTDCSIIALIAIKPEYDFQNKYLFNQFSSWLNLPEDTK